MIPSPCNEAIHSGSCLKWRCRNWRCTGCPAWRVRLHTLQPWGSAERIMPASADELADLENRLLSKQQSQFDALQKRLLLGNAAPTVVEVDQPFAEYARTFYLTAALVVYSLASMVYSSFTTV